MAAVGSRPSVEQVEALAQFLADLEVWGSLARHGYLLAGAWVAPDPLVTRAGGERTEAAQLDTIAAREGRADLPEHGIDDALDITW